MLADHPSNQLTSRIIQAAIEVHRHLGPGLLESAYDRCLVHELRARGMTVDTRLPVPLYYKGLIVECSYCLDLLVDGEVIVELKCIEQIAWIHQAQVLTYLRLTGREVALLINFNVPVLKQGIRRILNTTRRVQDP